jgi:hypothetical protein
VDLETFLAALAAGDTLTLADAQAALAQAEQLRTQAAESARATGDLAALRAINDTYTLVAQAVTDIEATETAAAAAVEAELSAMGITEPVTEPTTEPVVEAPVAASRMSYSEAVAALGITTNPRQAAPVDDLSTTTHTLALNGRETNDATWRDLGAAFAENRVVGKARSLIVQGTTEFAEDRVLSGNAATNTAVMDDLLARPAAPVNPVTAACCSLATPDRDYGSPASSVERPVRDALPLFGGPAGGDVEAFAPACLPDTGAQVWTCDDQDLVDDEDPETWKGCADDECGDNIRVKVNSVPACMTFSNHTVRFAPEQWARKLQKLSALQARVAEVALIQKIQGLMSTTHTGVDTGVFFASFVNEVILATETIREDQRYGDDTVMTVIAESWARGAAAASIREARSGDVESLIIGQSILRDALMPWNINLVFSADYNRIESGSQVDGPLTPYPATSNVSIFADRDIKFIDGGRLDGGLETRDSTLNRQNKVSAFWETFEGVLGAPCNGKNIQVPVTIPA